MNLTPGQPATARNEFTAGGRFTARFRQISAAVSLILAAALSVLWVALEPNLAESSTERLTQMADSGGRSAISLLAFVVSQLPFIVAVVGITRLISDRSPILAAVGVTAGVIGGFGHAVFGGAQLMVLGMAADTAHHDVYAGLLDGAIPAGLMIAMMAGTVGTVLGLILLGVGLLRARTGPRWIPYALWAFILVEFVGTNFTEWAALASGLLYLAAFCALAVTVLRSSVELWMNPTTMPRATDSTVAVARP